MEQIDYTDMLPTQPPEGMTEFLRKNKYLKKEYIVYATTYKEQTDGTKQKAVKCTCTACGETSINEYKSRYSCSHSYPRAPFGFMHPEYSEQVMCGDSTTCPICGGEVEAIHIGNISSGGRMMECCYPIMIANIEGKLAVIEWQAATILHKDGTLKLRYLPSEAAVVEKKKIIRCKAIRRYYYSYIDLEKWEQRVKYADEIGKRDKSLIFPFEPEVLNGTYAENSKLDIYVRSCKEPMPVAYLKLWQIHKNVENLVTSGASELVTEALVRTSRGYTQTRTRAIAKNVDKFNWKEVKPHLMLGEHITKEEYRYIIKKKFKIYHVETWKEFKGYISIDEVEEAYKFGRERLLKVIEFGEKPSRAIRYLEKQKEKHKPYGSRIDSSILIDYWEMAQELGENLKDIAYPKNLISAHDGVVGRKKWKESEELRALFKERRKELKKYEWSDGELEIHPAKTENEMIVEGKTLHHCVARYAKAHANGKTAIFFIRHSEQPEIPYFTLELDEKNLKVRQNRGSYNCARTEEVVIFEKKWLKFIEEVHNNVRNNRSKVS